MIVRLADVSPTPFAFPSTAASAAGVATRGLSTNAAILDAVVFVLGIALLGGVLVWYGRRIFRGQ